MKKFGILLDANPTFTNYPSPLGDRKLNAPGKSTEDIIEKAKIIWQATSSAGNLTI